MRLLLIGMLAIGLMNCATGPRYRKAANSTSSAEEKKMKKDKMDCEVKAGQAGHKAGYLLWQKFVDECMETKGWE